MIEVKVEQGTPKWLKMRLGKITGTRLKEVFKSDNLPLIDEMIAEIDSEEIEENYVNQSMQRGKDLEQVVKAIYEQVKDIEIDEVGFCLSEENDYLALSPDGFTKDRLGAIEIKCPSTKVHVKYIRMNKIPSEYLYQVYCYFLINQKLEWLDFISYDDRFNSRPMWIKRVKREEIENELILANIEIEKFIVKFEKYYKQVTQ